MQISPPPIKAGQQVFIRRARWQVLDVDAFDGGALLTVAALDPSGACANASATGTRRAHAFAPHPDRCHFLVPFDDVESIERVTRPRFVRPAVWRRACRALLAADVPPGSLQSVRHAAIDVMPHQLEPALAILRGLGSRVLVADEVGLGKTIQAAIVISELMCRGFAERVLVLVPSGLRQQWTGELSTRFAIDARIASAAALRRQAAALPVGMNPWIVDRVAVASIDYVKRPEVLAAVSAVRWDIVIVDEVHASAGDSDRRGAVHALASRAPFVLLLTATPHNGDRRAFVSLCGLGAAAGDRLVVFRRTRASIRIGAGRRVHTLMIRPSADESRMHALLRAYTDAMCIERPDAWLAMSVLHKRALSSAWALARSVERRLDALTTTRPAPAEQLRLPLWDRDGEYSDADESPPWPPGIGLADVEHDAQMLGRLLACARTAAMHDSKLAALRRLLRRAREPAIVFTEFRDTLLHVQQVLGRPAVVLHGGLTADERSKALNDFAAGRRPVLLATDAGGEGLNLHHAARLVVNLELPWNPVRLEQRVGRVDRIGQRRRVHAFHLVARDTGEARILDRLRTRIATAHDDLALDRAFGSDEERAVAQLAILGTAAADETAAEPIAAALEWPDLAGESTREADRLARARAMQSADDNRPSPDRQSPIDRPLIWRTRRARLRAALGRRALLLWRVRCEDASGHIVGSTLVPIYVDVASPTSLRPRREIARWLADAEDRTRPLVLAATADWHAHVEEQRRAFIAARRTREASIAGAPTPNRDARFQPGLFDRRAERRRLIAAAGSHDDEVERRQRLDALNRSEAIDRSEAELLLVLLPPGTGERFETD